MFDRVLYFTVQTGSILSDPFAKFSGIELNNIYIYIIYLYKQRMCEGDDCSYAYTF